MSLDRLHPTYLYAGPIDAKLAVVGQTPVKGGQYPFCGAHDTLFAWEVFGEGAFDVGWTLVQEIPPQVLREKNGIITCGKRAEKWLEHVVGYVPFLPLPTTTYLFTRLQESEIATVYEEVKTFVENHTKIIKEGNSS
jgi:hypothetical protein